MAKKKMQGISKISRNIKDRKYAFKGTNILSLSRFRNHLIYYGRNFMLKYFGSVVKVFQPNI